MPDQSWLIGFASFNRPSNPSGALLEGRLQLPAPGREHFRLADMGWSNPEDRHPSWALWYHSLKWVDGLVRDCRSAGGDFDRSRPEWALAVAVVHSWIDWESTRPATPGDDHWNGHPTALRLSTLLGITQGDPGDDVVGAAVDKHVDHLMDERNFDGLWNHGLVQSLALLGAGLQLARADVEAVARDRVFRCAEEMVDEQGAINEQAPGYASFVYSLLGVADRIYRLNRLDGREYLRGRMELLARFGAHATQPDGKFVQLGDTLAEEPRQEFLDSIDFMTEPTTAVYDRGYVFARSGWEVSPDSRQDFFSLRFGPGRIIHGHNDHMSITWMYQGRHVLVDSGHVGYKPGPYRAFLQSPAAHNVPVVEGVKHDWSAPTRLVRSECGGPDGSQFFEVEDRAYPGARRVRGISFTPGSPLLVLDRVMSDGNDLNLRTLWHFAEDFDVVRLDESFALLSSAHLKIGVYALRLSESALGLSSGYSRGSELPWQGWRSMRLEEREASPTISFGNRLAAGPVATLFVPGFTGREAVRVTAEDGGRKVIALRGGQKNVVFHVSPGGYVAARAAG